jgi:hypothetical protein
LNQILELTIFISLLYLNSKVQNAPNQNAVPLWSNLEQHIDMISLISGSSARARQEFTACIYPGNTAMASTPFRFWASKKRPWSDAGMVVIRQSKS